MSPAPWFRRRSAAALVFPLILMALGCNAAVDPTETTGVPETPAEVLDPQPPADEAEIGNEPSPDEAAPTESPSEPTEPQASASSTTPSLVAPTDLAAAESASAAEAPSDAAEGIDLVAMTFDEFRQKGVVHPDAKLTMVDAWATWCGPCKENFPHLVEMSEKYADKGLKVVSLSLDDPGDQAALEDARTFLNEQKAHFTHVLLNEDYGVGFEKLNVNTIPAVFLYDSSGKEIGHFTIDDPNNQFTYDSVEQVVTALLEDNPVPADALGYYPAGQESQ